MAPNQAGPPAHGGGPPVPPAGPPAPPAGELTLTPFFKLVFLTVAILTILSLAVSFYVAGEGKPSDLAKALFETCSTTWKMGFGAIIGLIGGKAIK